MQHDKDYVTRLERIIKELSDFNDFIRQFQENPAADIADNEATIERLRHLQEAWLARTR